MPGMEAFLVACATRRSDSELLRLINTRLTYNGDCWRIEWRAGVGRCLVASRPITMSTLVFTERPLVVANGGSAAVARGIQALKHESPEYKGVLQLQARADVESERESEKWFASLAAINVHGAGGTFLDRNFERRAVLGLLASMMQHECAPSAVTHISSAADGSRVSVRTIRPLEVGEPISISYLATYQPASVRQELLQMQHGFTCVCPRCTTLPELVRAFRCPNCAEGPCSPTSPLPSCRELACDHCEARMLLDDETLSCYERAEHAEDVGACMEYLHPYHHRMVKMYQNNLLKLSGAQRAQVLMQHAEARARMYAGFAHAHHIHPLVANDIEAAAVALLDAGELTAAAEAFADATQRFGAFYGPGADMLRCSKAKAVQSLAEYRALLDEVPILPRSAEADEHHT